MPHQSSQPDNRGWPVAKGNQTVLAPFLKWPGGKRWLVEQYPELFARSYIRYIEPFLGAGSVYFHLRPAQAILGDLNNDLIIAYRGIKEKSAEVESWLEKHHSAHSAEYYYQVRESEPSSLAAQAARIIYLNRTCFNGIYRVNKRGRFNVPIGDRDQVVRDVDDFAAVSNLLSSADLRHSDFEPLIDESQANDMVFLDPPYTVRHNRNGFIKYNEKLFSWGDQERLAKAATRAAERGALIVATNAFHETICQLYNADIFGFRKVSRYSAISASLESRKHFDELVIISK